MSKELKAGLVMVISIVAFIVMFQFMRGNSLLSSDNTYYAQYANVQGLRPSSEVTINGLKVGQVKEISPQTKADGSIYFIVKLTVDDQFKFSKRSTVEVFEPGLMDGKVLRINILPGQPFAQDGDTLPTSTVPSMIEGITSQVAPLSQQAQKALKTVDSLAANANLVFDNQNRQEIAALLRNLNVTVQALQGTNARANALIANNDPRVERVLGNADRALISANAAIGNYGDLAKSVDTRQLNQAIASLDVTAQKLNAVVSKIDQGDGSLGKLVNDQALYDNLKATSEGLNDLIKDVKANPKRYVNFSVFGSNNKVVKE